MLKSQDLICKNIIRAEGRDTRQLVLLRLSAQCQREECGEYWGMLGPIVGCDTGHCAAHSDCLQSACQQSDGKVTANTFSNTRSRKQ